SRCPCPTHARASASCCSRRRRTPTAAPCSARPRRAAPPSSPCLRRCRWSTRCRCLAPARPTMSPPPPWPASSRRVRRSGRLRNSRPTAVASAEVRCDGVVLLHGIGVGSWSLKRMERALRRRGFATLNLGYASRRKPLEALVEDIHAPIAAFAQACDGDIHFVAHSMGGLLARLYVAKHRPARLGRVVMRGTPDCGDQNARRPAG